MYLLIPFVWVVFIINTYNLHPTMYLLIHRYAELDKPFTVKFTSHYVSINSLCRAYNLLTYFKFTSHYVSINSIYGLFRQCYIDIYIPLCIY